MFNLYGFCKISSLSDNSKGQVSPIGELSSTASSFSRDKRFYRGKGTDIELVVFESTLNSVDTEPTIAYTDITTQVLQWIFDQAIGDRFNESEDSARELIQTNFVTSIRDLKVGSMVNVKGSWFPTWISFIKDGSEENRIIVWLSDSVFQYQYTGFHIIGVGPIDNIDIFQKTRAQVIEALADFSIPGHNDKVQLKSDNIPYTNLTTKEYTWHDREDASSTYPTIWSTIIYGAAGTNASRRKRALQEYILANSEYSRADWVKVFPEIFTSNEFTFVPYWELSNKMNETDQGALYSPIVSYEKITDKIKWFFKTIENTEVDDINNIEGRPQCIVPVHYKSLSCLVVTGESNPANIQYLTDVYQDYAMIPVSSKQLSRLAEETCTFIRMLVTALGYAEGLYDFAVVDHDYSIVEINGSKFYTFEHKNVEYRIYIHPERQSMMVA